MPAAEHSHESAFEDVFGARRLTAEGRHGVPQTFRQLHAQTLRGLFGDEAFLRNPEPRWVAGHLHIPDDPELADVSLHRLSLHAVITLTGAYETMAGLDRAGAAAWRANLADPDSRHRPLIPDFAFDLDEAAPELLLLTWDPVRRKFGTDALGVRLTSRTTVEDISRALCS